MADIDVHYDPISVVSGPVTIDVQGLDSTKNTITIETPQPVKSETKIDVAVTQPINTDSKFEFSTPAPLRAESKAELDVKPLALDQCLRISLAPLPPTCIRFPIHQRIGLTLFGIEFIGLRFSGESQVLICDAPKDPHIVWGEVGAASRLERPDDALLPGSDGLRIRLGG